MSLCDIEIKPNYTSNDDLINNFYIPSLSEANHYDRAVGFFGSSVYSFMARGLAPFIKKRGIIRLIIGASLTENEYNAIEQSLNNTNDFLEIFDKKLLNDLDYNKNMISLSKDELNSEGIKQLFDLHLDMFAWLISRGFLKIKVAFREVGMFHSKIGKIYDDDGNTILFVGSNNETEYALRNDRNYEEMEVYTSWENEDSRHYKAHFNKFDDLWNNRVKGVCVLPLTDANFFKKTKELFKKNNRNLQKYHSFSVFEYEENGILLNNKKNQERKLWFQSQIANKLSLINEEWEARERSAPKIPDIWKYQHRSIQDIAMASWKSADYSDSFQKQYFEIYKRYPKNKEQGRGILQLATGAGKTRIAIMTAIQFYNSRRERGGKLALIISVPQVSLAEQWVETLNQCNIYPIKCWNSYTRWKEDFSARLQLYKSGTIDFIPIVAVNNTLTGENFKRYIQSISPNDILFIGDECHNLSNQCDNLPNAKYKIGLSATPFNDYECQGDFNLINYFGDVCCIYSLQDALNDNILSKYYYHVLPVSLSNFPDESGESELDRYKKISRMIASKLQEEGVGYDDPELLQLFLARTRVLGAAKNKFNVLRDALNRWCPTPQNFTLFFCGEGSDPNFDEESDPIRDKNLITTYTDILNEMGWYPRQFTAANRDERPEILRQFKEGRITSLLAMKCLDEGIDIPACKQAFLLASANKVRQYVQRRGRVLRKRNEEDEVPALIVDFFVYIPPTIEQSEMEKNLIERELKRITEFAASSLNANEALNDISLILSAYNISI